MNCVLRKWRLSDAPALAASLNNEKILNNLRDGLPFPYTEQDARDYITAMLSADEASTFAYAVTLDDRAVGSIGAFRQGNIHRQTAEVGYYLAEEYWGRGIMTQAIRQLCAILFDSTDLLRIYAEPFAYNTGSRRALEKAGFCYEGTMKNNAVKNGKVVDMALDSLTRNPEPYPVRRLFEAMRRDYTRQAFTVHAAPCAVEVYRHLGFSPTGGEQTVNGLRFTPMQYGLGQAK